MIRAGKGIVKLLSLRFVGTVTAGMRDGNEEGLEIGR